MLEAMKKLDPYDAEMVELMKNLYQTYTEKDRRRYAAIEAKKLGYGGISYICRIFGCSEKSVNHGLSELENLLALDNKRIRKSGGGSKKILETSPGINEAFLAIMSAHTAGSPMDETIKWSNLGPEKIAEEMAEQGYKISKAIVNQLLDKHDFRRRKAFKNEAGKEVGNRNEQFENIEKLVKFAHENGNPAMSMDVKKKS